MHSSCNILPIFGVEPQTSYMVGDYLTYYDIGYLCKLFQHQRLLISIQQLCGLVCVKSKNIFSELKQKICWGSRFIECYYITHSHCFCSTWSVNVNNSLYLSLQWKLLRPFEIILCVLRVKSDVCIKIGCCLRTTLFKRGL